MCTSGDSYITINNYKSKKRQAVDGIRFEFKSHMTGTGLIMSAKGSHVDYVSVGYKNRRLWYNVNLGSGKLILNTIKVDFPEGYVQRCNFFFLQDGACI